MKVFNTTHECFELEASKLPQEYRVIRQKKFFWQKKEYLAIITVIPGSAYSILSLTYLQPKLLEKIIEKARELAQI